MSRSFNLIWLTCFLFLFISCGKDRVSTPSVSADSYSYASNNPTQEQPADPASDRFIVPPELAVMNASINATASSFDTVTKLLDTSFQQLIKNIDLTKGCAVEIIDYQSPVPRYSKRITSQADWQYSSSLNLELSMAFTETQNVRDRIKQVNRCLQAIPDLKLVETPEDKNASVNLVVSSVIPTVNNAGKYRQEILETKLIPFKEIAEISEPAIQFEAQDTKCTSQGNVKITDRNFSGIALDIDLDCVNLRRINN